MEKNGKREKAWKKLGKFFGLGGKQKMGKKTPQPKAPWEKGKGTNGREKRKGFFFSILRKRGVPNPGE